LSVTRDCLFNYSQLPSVTGGLPLIRNLRTRHVVVTRAPPNMGFFHTLSNSLSTNHATILRFITPSFLGSTAQLRPWPPQNPAEFLGGFSTFFVFTGYGC
jgi:hypothetical protein